MAAIFVLFKTSVQQRTAWDWGGTDEPPHLQGQGTHRCDPAQKPHPNTAISSTVLFSLALESDYISQNLFWWRHRCFINSPRDRESSPLGGEGLKQPNRNKTTHELASGNITEKKMLFFSNYNSLFCFFFQLHSYILCLNYRRWIISILKLIGLRSV